MFGGSIEGLGLGISLLYAQDTENFISLEMLAHFRLYLSRLLDVKKNTGVFVQIEAGFVLFWYEKFEIERQILPAAGLDTGWNIPPIGLAVGWRIPLGKTHLFIEPAIRGGYPYIFGAGLSAGLRFD